MFPDIYSIIRNLNLKIWWFRRGGLHPVGWGSPLQALHLQNKPQGLRIIGRFYSEYYYTSYIYLSLHAHTMSEFLQCKYVCVCFACVTKVHVPVCNYVFICIVNKTLLCRPTSSCTWRRTSTWPGSPCSTTSGRADRATSGSSSSFSAQTRSRYGPVSDELSEFELYLNWWAVIDYEWVIAWSYMFIDWWVDQWMLTWVNQ